jgi:hypothetical protein
LRGSITTTAPFSPSSAASAARCTRTSSASSMSLPWPGSRRETSSNLNPATSTCTSILPPSAARSTPSNRFSTPERPATSGR